LSPYFEYEIDTIPIKGGQRYGTARTFLFFIPEHCFLGESCTCSKFKVSNVQSQWEQQPRAAPKPDHKVDG